MLKSHTPRFSLLLVTILLIGPEAGANSFGPPAGSTGSIASAGNSCAQAFCHTGDTGSGGVEILGAPGSYEVKTVYDLRVRIHDAAQLAAGFQLSVEDASGAHVGTLIVTDPVNTALNFVSPDWIQHTFTGISNSSISWAASGNEVEYAFQWRAPSTDAGNVTFWAAGNAVNLNFFNTLDHVYLTSTTSLATQLDSDLDGIPDDGGAGVCGSGATDQCDDNCPFEPNNSGNDVQKDSDGDGRGDACECGNADRNANVDIFDALHIAQGTLVPPLVEMIHPRACDTDGNGACDIFDALRVAQATLSPPLAEIVQECEAATVAP